MIDESIIAVRNLKKYFGEVKAVNGISFDVRKGEVFGLLGPNGAGKTTTIKLLLGLLEPLEGEIRILGLNPEREEVLMKKNIGYVSEESLIFKSLTPKDLFNFIASIRQLDPKEATERVQEYSESLGTIEYYNQIIASLSHGNKQKIQIISSIESLIVFPSLLEGFSHVPSSFLFILVFDSWLLVNQLLARNLVQVQGFCIYTSIYSAEFRSYCKAFAFAYTAGILLYFED